jgi:hypothetical protein
MLRTQRWIGIDKSRVLGGQKKRKEKKIPSPLFLFPSVFLFSSPHFPLFSALIFHPFLPSPLGRLSTHTGPSKIIPRNKQKRENPETFLRSRVSFKKIPSRVFFQTIMLGL